MFLIFTITLNYILTKIYSDLYILTTTAFYFFNLLGQAAATYNLQAKSSLLTVF